MKKRTYVETLSIYIMMLPALIYMFVNNYLPMFGIFIAFKDLDYRKGIFKSDWIGLKNFEYLFKTKDAFIITRNTLCYNIMFIILGIVIGVFVAIILNEIGNKFASRFYQSAILLPYLMSMVIISNLAFAMLSTENGFLNNSILPLFGASPISWYTEAKYWPFILVFIHIWHTIGYTAVIYYASIVGISNDFYEAARIDGATKIKQIFHITIPLLKPTIITLTILGIGRIFYSDFGLFYQIPRSSGALFSVTQTIDTYVYRGLMEMGDVAMSSAAGVYQSFVGFVLIIVANAVIKKLSAENALF